MKTVFIVFIIIIALQGFSQSIDEQIIEVENNLLPVNIFEGEKAYHLEERMKFYQVPGISITVIKDFKVLWTKYYGFADQELKTKVNQETLFNVGSLSKGMASLTMLSLVQKGKLHLDDDVNDHLKSWMIPKNKWSGEKKITPLLLMNHSSGAMHHFAVNYTRNNLPNITQLLNGESPARERPTIIDHEPGIEFLYSNPGFAILQQVAEDICNEPFYLLAQNEVIIPLKMTQTTFQQPLPPTLEANAAAGHHGSKPLTVKRYYYPNTAAGGLWTSSEDFAKYVVEIQKSYHQKSNKIISAELTKEMVSPHVSKQYGLGLFLRDIGTEKYFGHMGDNAGFFAGFIAHLTNGYGVIIFTNSNSSPELIREINMAVAKVYHWEGFLPKSIKVVSLTPEEKIKYCGRFRVGSDEVLKINLVNGELLIENMDDEKLYYIGNNTFKIKRRSGELIYHLEGDQAIGIQYHFSDELGRSTNKLTQGRIMSDNEYTALEMMHMGKINKAIREYKELFDKNPMDENVSENRFNKMGYNFISSQNLKAALAIFKLNTELYPTSSNCYDSYAEALALMGNKHQAIKNYRKAIDLDDQAQNAKDQLKRLEENN